VKGWDGLCCAEHVAHLSLTWGMGSLHCFPVLDEDNNITGESL